MFIDASRYAGVDLIDFLAGELPFVVIALVGVGFLIRRSLRETISRLGYRKPTWRRVLLALLVAEALLVVASISGLVTAALTPDTYAKLGSVSDKMYSGFGPEILPWIALSIVGALCG